MIVKTPKFYKNFKCIAGACPDSCCQGWEVDADDDSLKFYESLTGNIRSKIDSVLSVDEFGNNIFTLVQNKRCPFLNSENLCDMHIAIGGEHTPYTCRMFPRFINDFGGTREMGVSFSCPVASDMMYDLTEPFDFVDEFNNDLPTLNDIDADLYFLLKKARTKAFEIVQNRLKPINIRLGELLLFAEKLQNEIQKSDEPTDDVDFFDIFHNPELINNEWLEKINSPLVKSVSNETYNENIACYFLFRYMLNAVYDKDVLSKVKMAVIGVLVNTYFGEDSWTIHLWSKETEHSQENMDRYKMLLKTAKCLSVEQLILRLK